MQATIKSKTPKTSNSIAWVRRKDGTYQTAPGQDILGVWTIYPRGSGGYSIAIGDLAIGAETHRTVALAKFAAGVFIGAADGPWMKSQ